MIKVTEADLKGGIVNFPIEVVQMMCKHQVEQGNKCDVSVFQKFPSANHEKGGFLWSKTKEGRDFWSDMMVRRKFDLFFKKYPKSTKKK